MDPITFPHNGGGVESPPKRKVFRFHETILSFGEPGSLEICIYMFCFQPPLSKPKVQTCGIHPESDDVAHIALSDQGTRTDVPLPQCTQGIYCVL